MFRFCLALAFLSITLVPAQEPEPALRVAVLDFAQAGFGRLASDTLARNLKSSKLSVLDRDESRAAATGSGYDHSLNLTRQQARELGAVLGCEYFIIGDAQTVRRSPSSGTRYFESYASLFLVSARTGNLIRWERPNVEASSVEDGERLLLIELSSLEVRNRFNLIIQRAKEDEARQREFIPTSSNPVIEDAPEDDKAAEALGLQLPRAFKRLRPAYPDSAARADAEATVDVLADIDTNGDVVYAEIARWAGYGLDEVTLETVRQLRFFPAMRNRVAIPIRVLLRYNFRKPAK
jgi:TonB family protein